MKDKVTAEKELEKASIEYSDKVNMEGETSFSIAEAFEAGAKSDFAKNYHANNIVDLDKLWKNFEHAFVCEKHFKESVFNWFKPHLKPKSESEVSDAVEFLDWVRSREWKRHTPYLGGWNYLRIVQNYTNIKTDKELYTIFKEEKNNK